MLSTISTLAMLSGVAIYQRFFKDHEMRTLQYYCNFLSILSLGVDLAQVFRVNLDYGISDMVVLCFGNAIFGAFAFAMTQLPSLVLFQKLVPDHVEATMMALSASTINLSRGLMGDLMGVFVNSSFVGITEKDFDGVTLETVTPYYILVFIGFMSCLYEFTIIPLIPIKAEIMLEIDKRNASRKNTALGRKTSVMSAVEVAA